MATILVTGAGGACGIGAIRSFKTETDHEVVGVDMDPAAAGIYLADSGTEVPAATDDSWPDVMAEAVVEFGVDAIVPTVDEELDALPALASRLGDIPIIAPDQSTIEVSLDKYHTSTALAAADIPIPETWLGTEAASIDPSSFPLVVKPRRGRGSRGMSQVTNPDELASYLAESEHEPTELLCQELVPGVEYTTSVVATADNRLLGVVPKEAIEKQGSTVLGATRRAPAVAESCRRIFETLQPAGPLNIQQILDENGTPRVIEINPRFSSTSCLTVAAGVDEFDLLVRDALGEDVQTPADFEPDRYIIRYDSHLFVDAEESGRLAAEDDTVTPMTSR